MTSRRRAPRIGRAITFWWDNPPGRAQGGTIVRVIRGQVYERTVGPRDVLDVQEAAAALGDMHPFSVYRLIRAGRLRVVRQGRQVLLPLGEVKRYLRQRTPGRGRATGELWFSG